MNFANLVWANLSLAVQINYLY